MFVHHGPAWRVAGMKSELVPHMSGEVLTESKSMNKPLLNSQAVLPHWEPKYPFDLVVAYEDLATRNRALLLYDHLSEQLIDEYDFQCTWWKLDHLCSQTLREQAAD